MPSSASRHGARYEILKIWTAITEMEKIAKNYEGVEDAYALSGRELRVIIILVKLDDAQTVLLSRKIQEEVQ